MARFTNQQLNGNMIIIFKNYQKSTVQGLQVLQINKSTEKGATIHTKPLASLLCKDCKFYKSTDLQEYEHK